MHKTIQVYFIIVLMISVLSCTESSVMSVEFKTEKEIQIIPQVQSLKVNSSYFEISAETAILVLNDSTKGAVFFKNLIEKSSHFTIPIIQIDSEGFDKKRNYIFIDNTRKFISLEGYELKIDSNSMMISAMNNKSILHAIQTLRQLFVDEFHSGEKRDTWYLPAVEISDAPKFKHRGLLLDCSRHFFGKKTIKKYIDLLSLYKMNVLHWHLTEDQGWRIEIDAFPKLIEIGAWRTEVDGSRYGGFYTKDDIREIVTYASDRGVTIIPEIELPGHCQAAIAAYPHLSCTGEKVDVVNDWGVFKEIYCAGNDSVFQFIEIVLDEVLELFPSEYIHIGGDEAPKFRWEHCDKCQKRMTDNDLNDEHELQSFFIRRIEKYLNSRGRKLIGWDEILEGGLSENATVQSWRGMEGGISAAKSRHDAIMSPTSHAYFDYDLKAIDLEKVYSFDPIPKNLEPDLHQYIIGGEGNMWSEHVPNDSVLDSKVFPRLLAMSEVLWSYPINKNYSEFYNRVQNHYPILEALDVNYGAEGVPVSLNVEIVGKEVSIEAEPLHESLLVKYKWISDSSDQYFPYQNAIKLLQSGTLEFQTFKKELPYGLAVRQKFEKHKVIGEVVEYKNLYNKWYDSGKHLGLVDGKIGSEDFKDGCWQGFWGDDIVVEIDLGKMEGITHLETHFFQYNNSWIFIPTEIEFEGSTDGKVFFSLGKMQAKTDPKLRGKSIENFILKVNNLNMQYIRLVAKNVGKVPNWHEAAGSDAWLFIDEIVIK